MTKSEIQAAIVAANLVFPSETDASPRFLLVENETREIPDAVDMSLINVGTASAIVVNRFAEGFELAPGESVSIGRKGFVVGLQIIATETSVKIMYFS